MDKPTPKLVTRLYFVDRVAFRDAQDRLFITRTQEDLNGEKNRIKLAVYINEHTQTQLHAPIDEYSVIYSHVFNGHGPITRVDV